MNQHLPLLAIALLLGACSPRAAEPAQIDPPFPAPGTLPQAAHVYPVETGWFDGQPMRYYNLGTNTPLNPDDSTRVLVKNVWQFNIGENADGAPIALEGQNNLFDTTVGDADYSDMWLPHFVTASSDYVPNTVRSADELLTSNFLIEKQPLFVNCPIVPDGSSLKDEDLPLKIAWVRGVEVSYFDFGPTSPTPGKVYAFVTGFDESGSPRLLPGQHLVFDSTRSERGYSDFWIVQWVVVDSNYQADSIRSAVDIRFEVQPSTLVVNYPHKQ